MSSGSLVSWESMEDRIPACYPLQHVRKLWWNGSLMGPIRPSVSSTLPTGLCWVLCFRPDRSAGDRHSSIKADARWAWIVSQLLRAAHCEHGLPRQRSIPFAFSNVRLMPEHGIDAGWL